MKRISNTFLQIVLSIITVLFFLILTLTIIHIADKQEALEKYIIYIGTTLSIFFIFLFKRKKIYFLSGVTVSILCICINFLVNIETRNNDNEQSNTIPFYSLDNGLIFLEAKIGEETKYVLFDTGAGISAFNETYSSQKGKSYIDVTDSNGKTKNLKIQKLNKLSFNNIQCKNVEYLLMNQDTWKKECGIFFNQDSIAGILGNNIINLLVWDFDMQNKKVTVSPKKELKDISKAKVIPLFKESKQSWGMKIKVNGKQETVLLDSGCDYILNLKDAVTLQENYRYKIDYQESRGLFSYEDCDQKDTTKIITENSKEDRLIFADLKISNTTFSDAFITDSSEGNHNLIGVPLFWEFERVIIDFPNEKMYLFNRNHSSDDIQSISAISYKSREKFIQKSISNIDNK